MCAAAMMARPFGTIGEMVRWHASRAPQRAALMHEGRRVTFGELDHLMDRVAAGLHDRGVRQGERIALCAPNSIEYAVVFLGALRAGVVCALVPPNLHADAIAAMVRDSGARRVFTADEPLEGWLGQAADAPRAEIAPGDAFNIIYSSGTTGVPKGIVQPHAMRWGHMQRGPTYHYDDTSITLLATPLYSNTTLVSFFPALAMGGSVLLTSARFDPRQYLELAERSRATHTMLVPVQYQRIMALEDFGRYDLASFRMKLSTSAHFPAALKRQVIERWPGELVEYYGMTEGGATCVLWAKRHPDKLHTVGPPAPGVDVRLIDDEGRELPRGESGEVVGRSAAMMTGYHGLPEETRRAEWHDAEGRRFIRTGDIGRFDADGFLTLLDRKKDLIISGGFNVYPGDLEAVLRAHPDVAEAAVVGIPSAKWGETPAGFVVARAGCSPEPEALLQWANERLGKVQRLSAVRLVAELPRSAIGKVLKRELREAYLASGATSSNGSGASATAQSPR